MVRVPGGAARDVRSPFRSEVRREGRFGMKALCWVGVEKVSVETVPDPRIENSRDAIVKVTASSMSGTDLHLIDGYVPGMREGDVLGHEFVGEVVETGPGVN